MQALERVSISPSVIDRYPHELSGFELQTELATLGRPAAAFGHTGAGGSSHGAWPVERLGYSYAMNTLCSAERDERARRLLAALHGSLAAGASAGSVADG